MKKKVFYYGLTFVLFGIIIVKLMMIFNNEELYKEKLEEKTQIIVYGASSPRGRILDTNGKILVDNKGIKTIYYNKTNGISVKKELEIAETLAKILTTKEASIGELKEYYLITHDNGSNLITEEEYAMLEMRKMTNEDIDKLKLSRITDDMLEYDDITKKAAHIFSLMVDGFTYSKKEISKKVSEEEYAKIIESNIPGITGEITWERIYPYGDSLKSIFGSVGAIQLEVKDDYLNSGYELTDLVGTSYLEKEYEEYLKGKKAKYVVNNDNTLTKIEEEERGNDLILAVDIDIQLKLEEILRKRILEGKNVANTEYYKDSYAIVSDPLNGEIIALSGVRLNNDNTFSDISLNTINKSFTMGSSVKGATIAVGYKYGLIDMSEYIFDSCVKLYYIPEKCSYQKLGRINDLKALAYSSNYYQYLIAIKLTGNTYSPNMKLNATIDDFNKYRNMLASFGLGVKTGIDLPGESIGIIGKKVADDLLLNLAIGQYDTYTPIEMIQYINTIATGKRYTLSLMQEIKNNSNTILKHEANLLNDIPLDNVYLERIREGLNLVLSEGTGRFHVPQGIGAVGKTGTAESFLDTDGDDKVDIATITSTFVAYYPKDNPKYSIVVITPNISHKEGSNDTMYYGASKISKDITTFLSENY